MPRQVLPGLSFEERPSLFAALVALAEAAQPADRTIEVELGDRVSVVVLDPDDVRAVLRSNAQKGRPKSTLSGIQGHIAADGVQFRRRRGSVIAALRDAASEPLPELSEAAQGGVSNLDTATLVMAHLSGAQADPSLVDLGRRSRTAMRTAIADRGPHGPLNRVYSELEAALLPCAPFVRSLLDRGWTNDEIAAEIVTLTFAGWASLAAVCRSAHTLGVGGAAVTGSVVTELLRIAPPGWLITREAVEPLELTGRPRIEPGTLLVMSPWLLQRDRRTWTKPTAFDAARRGTLEHPGYLPFGAGSRSCPAERYARTILGDLLTRQPAVGAADSPVVSLTDERSTCLVPKENQPQ